MNIPELEISRLIKPMEGWCSLEKAIKLTQLIAENSLRRCVEIGVFGGRSVATMALAQKHANLDGYAVGIDPWRNTDCLEGEHNPKDAEWWAKLDLHDIHRKCMEAIWANGLNDRVIIIRNNSRNARALFDGATIDLLHIDGCHSEVSARLDIDLWVPLVRPGGIVAFDDIDWPTVKNALAFIDKRLQRMEDVGSCRFYRVPDKAGRKNLTPAMASATLP